MELEKTNIHLYNEICQVIEQARSYVAQTTNSTLTLMYWQIGERINKELLDGERATYGRQIVSQLATKLQEQYGKRGFDEKNIRRMIQFAQIYPNQEIVVSLIRQFSERMRLTLIWIAS